MAFFDKNDYRLKELERALSEAEPALKDRIQKRIDKIRLAGPEWFVKIKGVAYKCPPEYQTEVGAREYDERMKDRVENGRDLPENNRLATVSQIIEYYLRYKEKRLERGKEKPGTIASARTICGHIKRHKVAKYTLIRLDQEPDLLEDFFDDFPEDDWSPKYIWNYFVVLKSAITTFIERHRLHGMDNPCEVVDVTYDFKSVTRVPTPEDYEKVYMATYTVGLPDDIRNLLTAVYESGLRVNEVIKWQVQDLDMSLPRHDDRGRLVAFPSFKTIISKQRKLMVVRRPMTQKLYEAMRAQSAGRTDGQLWPWTRPPYSAIRWLKCVKCGTRYNRSKRYRTRRVCNGECAGQLVLTGLYEEAGLGHMRPFHDYRYSRNFINTVEKGLDKETAKELQGWKTDAMHEKYLIREALDLAPAVMDSWKQDSVPTRYQK